jgi:hypothetical protein
MRSGMTSVILLQLMNRTEAWEGQIALEPMACIVTFGEIECKTNFLLVSRLCVDLGCSANVIVVQAQVTDPSYILSKLRDMGETRRQPHAAR